MLAGFLAIMFGLIMRVLKNVFEKAVEMKFIPHFRSLRSLRSGGYSCYN